MGREGENALEAAARRRREREAARAAAEPGREKRAAADARRAAKVRRNHMREALAEAGWFGRTTTWLATIVGLLSPIAVSVFVIKDVSTLAIAATSVMSLVCGWLAMTLHRSLIVAWRLLRLRMLGRGLDVDGYLQALGENRQRAEVVVRATFERPWPADLRASARDAVLEWMPTLMRIEWEGETLAVRSAPLRGTKYYRGGESAGETFFNSAVFHGCFLAIARRVLPRLEAVAPITHLAVELDGPVEDINAEP